LLPIPVVDTHVHFWDTAGLDHPWLSGSELLNRPYLPADYSKAAEGVPVERIVFVEAACRKDLFLDEVAWVTELARQDARVQGIVAAAPLERGDAVKGDLERVAANPLVKGVRPSIQADDQNRLNDAFVEGVKALETVGFRCDACVGYAKLPAVIELARRVPNTRFMLDHIGVPDIRSGTLDPWRQYLRELSALPNVWCKVSGVATTADRDHWTTEDLRPAVEHVIECFGFERCAFGSDWPVMLLATPYVRWVETLAAIVEGASLDEKRRLFHDNAVAFYGL